MIQNIVCPNPLPHNLLLLYIFFVFPYMYYTTVSYIMEQIRNMTENTSFLRVDTLGSIFVVTNIGRSLSAFAERAPTILQL